jgi:hypothetical protein
MKRGMREGAVQNSQFKIQNEEGDEAACTVPDSFLSEILNWSF